MIKRVPSRNARSKGGKVKYVLHICLLVGICFWLIYQVKHSHDRKEEFDKKETKHSSEVVDLGRKDLHSYVQELNKSNNNENEEEEEIKMGEELDEEEKQKLEQEREEAEMKHREEEEAEEQEGESRHEPEVLAGVKHKEEEEEEEQEEESKKEELEEEGGDGEVDEHDLEKLEGQADHDDDFNEGEDEDAESTEGEDRTRLEEENLMEDQDQDAGARSAHAAREEHYKADDASSAVTHDKPILSTKSENASLEHSDKDLATDAANVSSFTNNSTEGVNKEQNNQIILRPGQNLTTEGVDTVNATSANNEKLLANSEDNLHVGTNSSFSDDHSVPSNAKTQVSTEAGNDAKGEGTKMPDPSEHNEAQVVESTQARDVTTNGSTAEALSGQQATELKQSNNKTGSEGRQTENAGIEFDVSNKNIKPVVTADRDVSSGLSSTTMGATGDPHNETRESSDKSRRTEENPGNSNGDGKNENEGMLNLVDMAESAVANGAKEHRLDLGTLPENSSDGVNDGNAVSE